MSPSACILRGMWVQRSADAGRDGYNMPVFGLGEELETNLGQENVRLQFSHYDLCHKFMK